MSREHEPVDEPAVRAPIANPRPRHRPLAQDELGTGLSEYPPLLTVDEAARLLRVSKSTLYGHVSRGKYRDAVKRGRPLVFYRDRLVRDYFRNR